jgi:hypothetical protein
MTGPRTVAIFGSCITRDNFNRDFNPDYRRWYQVSAAANQSSVIALMSPPVQPEVEDADGLEEYDAWNVRSDLARTFLDELAEAQPDHLVLDFFGDVHFGLLELPDGRFITDNAWKTQKTAQYRRLVAAGGTRRLRLLTDTEEYLGLWRDALDRFAAQVAATSPRTRVSVHRGFYASRAVVGPTGRPRNLHRHAKLNRLPVARVNELWAELDTYAVTTHGWSEIDLRAEAYTSTVEHRWGAFWVHYTPDYYHRFLAEMHALDLEARLDPETAAKVAVVAAAARERSQNLSTWTGQAVKEQRRAIRAIERRGVGATLRARLGAKIRAARGSS